MATQIKDQINSCDSTTGFTHLYDAGAATLNTGTKQEGTGALNLGVDTAGSTDEDWVKYYYTFSQKDLSKYKKLSFYFYISSVAYANYLQQFEVLLGKESSADPTNYYKWSFHHTEYITSYGSFIKIDLDLCQAEVVGSMADLTSQVFVLQFHYELGNDGNSMTPADERFIIDDIHLSYTYEDNYDIKIDDVGYLLLPESGEAYSQTDLPFSVDRFSTGELEYSDFNFFQYQSQTDWTGGFNNEFLSDNIPNAFYDGHHIDASKFGELKLAPNLALISGLSTSTISMNNGFIGPINSYNASAIICYQDENVGGVPAPYKIFSWSGNGTTLTFQKSGGVGDTTIYDSIVYNSDLYVSTNSGLLNYDGSTWTFVNEQLRNFAILGDTLYSGSGSTMYSTTDGSTWTTEFTDNTWTIERMKTWRGKIYYLGTQTKSSKSALFSWDGVDKIMLHEFEDRAKSDIEMFQNALWFVVGGYLYSYDGQSINEDLDLFDDFFLDEESGGLYAQSSLNLFGNDAARKTEQQNFQTLGNIMYAFSNNTTTSTKLFGRALAWYPALDEIASNSLLTSMGVYKRTNDSKGTLLIGESRSALSNLYYLDEYSYDTAYSNRGLLESSWIDMNFPNVDKIMASMAIYTEELPDSTKVIVSYKIDDDDNNWTRLFSHDVSGEKFKELDFVTGTIGKKIKYRLELTTGDTTETPVVNDVVIKYLVAPDIKRKWSVSVLISDDIIKLSNSRDTNTANKLMRKIWDARRKKSIVDFDDLDGSTHRVLINDIQISSGARNKTVPSKQSGPEYVATLELIEA